MKMSKNVKIWWDDEKNLARSEGQGILTIEDAQFILEETIRIAELRGNRIDWCIDLSRLKKPSPGARKILAEASAHPSIRKYAFVGASVFVRTIANFIMSAASQENARHFANEKDALDWIKEEREDD
jgi:hypothetical protein